MFLGGLRPLGDTTRNTDVNTLKTPGTFRIVTGCTNLPVAGEEGHLHVIKTMTNQDVVTQIFIQAYGGSCYQRVCWYGDWSAWYRLDNFGCSTPADLASLLGVVPTAIPIVGYDASLLDDYEQKYIMPFIGGDGAGVLMHIPLQWGTPKKNGCLSVHISPTAITVRSYWNNAWSESKSVPLT